MTGTVVDFPIFDADNHMYETPEAFTKFLPPEYEGLIKYVKVGGRDKIGSCDVFVGGFRRDRVNRGIHRLG
jgi:hypothetical protein